MNEREIIKSTCRCGEPVHVEVGGHSCRKDGKRPYHPGAADLTTQFRCRKCHEPLHQSCEAAAFADATPPASHDSAGAEGVVAWLYEERNDSAVITDEVKRVLKAVYGERYSKYSIPLNYANLADRQKRLLEAEQEAHPAPPSAAPVAQKCAICGYVGTETDDIGQCPSCHWDELAPIAQEGAAEGDDHAYLCVSACMGIDEDWLRSALPGSVPNVIDERNEYKAQNDALRAQLAEADRMFAAKDAEASVFNAAVQKWAERLRTAEEKLAASEARVVEQGDIREDRKYRDGLMAGWNFGVQNDEAGYQRAMDHYTREIAAAVAALSQPSKGE